ncbi:trehalase-like domain-containing protein [Streptomyces sp. NPDC051064]|uniref:trehalase-like domain-containing protein n=1 Tax=Streptomyces sp. NPDC051064 TaxID=3365641 RepID=UPI00379066C1
MDRYPPIAAHSLVGDLQTGTLISSQGVVDRFAAPRSDSPSVFAAPLDHDRGGCFRLSPEDPENSRKQLHYPDTAVLVTRASCHRTASARCSAGWTRSPPGWPPTGTR